jgi:hypothetical protein
MAKYHKAVTGKALNAEWGVDAGHALYHRDGNWYHILERFPGALFDPFGYVLFRTRDEFDNCPHLQIGQHVHVPRGISSIPGYRRMVPKTTGFEKNRSQR